MTELSYCFVFVCQRGDLEAQAALLAASLRKHLRCSSELVAALPAPAEQFGSPDPRTLALLSELGVRFEPVSNTIDPTYPIGNKVACLGVETRCDKIVFLDSDILCMSEFRHDERFGVEFNAKPADLIAPGHDAELWKRAYAVADAPLPDTTILTTVSRDPTPPYFNAGLVAARDGAALARAWRDSCVAIDRASDIEPKRPWLDQIALPVAVAKLGLEVDYLPETYNFPAHLRRLEEQDRTPIFCHYHHPKRLLGSARAVELVEELRNEHPGLGGVLARDRRWAEARRRRARRSRDGIRKRVLSVARSGGDRLTEAWHRAALSAVHDRNAIVTGYPRSGTSLFSALLNDVDDVVCLNEIYRGPRQFRFFKRTRRKILAGEPIRNKYADSGRLATNTLDRGTQVLKKVVKTHTDRFVLAQKYTLPYLNRLPEFVREGWSVWVVVRHPRYAISSWMHCPIDFAIARINPPDELLRHIPFSTPDVDRRRIEVWNHYAEVIDGLHDHLHVVRYEDLVADPRGPIERFCTHFDLELPKELPGLQSQNRSSSYPKPPQGFVDAVNEGCRLDLFGYEPAVE